MTLSDLFALAWKLHWNKPRYQKSRWAKVVEGYWRNHLDPAFGKEVLTDVTPKKIRHWLSNYAESPYAGNRSLEVLSRMFSLAEEEELIPLGSNPCKIVKSLPEVRRDRYATEDEIVKIMSILEAKLKKLKSRPGAAFILTLLLTGCRPISLRKAKRSDIRYFNHNGETWGLIQFVGKSTYSTGNKEKVIFPPRVLELIASIRPPKDDSLFGVYRARTLWWNVIKEAGCEDLWSRDLRRTFASIGVSSGVGMDVIGELLNHSSTQTTKIYAKLMDNKRVDAVSHITDQITSIGRAKETKPAS